MDVNATLKQFIVSELVRDSSDCEFCETTPLIESGIIDSMGIVKLLAFVDETFSVQISDDEISPENFETLDTLAALVSRKLSDG